MQTPSTQISQLTASPSALNSVLPSAAANSTRMPAKRISTLVVLAVLLATSVAVAMTRDSASAVGNNTVQQRAEAAPTSAQASVSAAHRALAGTAGGVPVSAFRWR